MPHALRYGDLGRNPGDSLPPLAGLGVARHTKGGFNGVKRERSGIRTVPKAEVELIGTTGNLLEPSSRRSPARPIW